MSETSKRTRQQRLLDAFLHRGPGYDLAPTPSVPEAEGQEQRPTDAEARIRQLQQTIRGILAANRRTVDGLRERAESAERQVKQAQALVAKWREVATERDDAVILVGVAADVLMATLDGFNDLLGEGQ